MSFPTQALHRLFSSGSVALLGWRNESGWPIDFATQSVQDILGYDSADLVDGGISLADLIHASEIRRIRVLSARHCESGSNRFEPEDFRVKAADGAWRWIQCSVTIERDVNGEAVRFFAYLLDVTARQKAQRTHEAQRRRLELVIQGTRLGMWDWNPQTNDVMFNGIWAEMLGHDFDEITPSLTEWESRVHPDDLAACYADITAHMEGRAPFYENVHRMRHKDGSWVYILDRGQIMERDEAGRPTRFTGTHTDITQEKLAELEAKRANDAKSLFLANMSHEIRTPLNGVLGVVQLLESTELSAEQRDYLSLIRESGEGLLTVINDVLDFSKIEAGELQIDPHSFELSRMAGRVVELYSEPALRKGLCLSVEAAGEIPAWVVADSHRVQQILMNLVSNAVKFTDAGSVVLSLDAHPTLDGAFDIQIRVRDTGKGIADTVSIFDSFRQEDASISRSHGGTGLGLAISRRLARLLGGRLEVESEPAQGATFTLHFPAHRGEAAEPSETAATFARADLRSLRILVAEDNGVNQIVVRGVLEKLGAEVDVVSDGRQAVETAKRGAYDLILMDVHMPEMDGLEATRALRADPSTAGIPIAALSADAMEESHDMCVAAGMDAFMTKPFRVEEFAEVIRAMVDTHGPTEADRRRRSVG